MEVYLKTDFDQWFSFTRGYKVSVDNSGIPLEPEQWTPDMKKKVSTDFKALNMLQCGLTKEELNQVGPFQNAKELWGKLIELHEGTSDAKVTKHDLLLNRLFNIKIQKGETASQLHVRIKDVLNRLHAIGHQMENHDLIRYALNAFPRNNLWASIVDAYKISKKLSKLKLDELFCGLKLHEQTNVGAKKGIVLFAGSSKERTKTKPEVEDESDQNSEDEEYLVNLVRKMFTGRKKRFSKKDLQKINSPNESRNVTYFGCNKKGHYKNECQRLKSDKTKTTKKKTLKATWDDSSSEELEVEDQKHQSHLALMAFEAESEDESEDGSESESSHESVLVSKSPEEELRSAGSRAEDAASEKDDTGREPTGSVRPKDERAAEEYIGGREECARCSRDVKPGRKTARGECRKLGSGEPYFGCPESPKRVKLRKSKQRRKQARNEAQGAFTLEAPSCLFEASQPWSK